jgi:hypothetical protein
MEIHFHPHSTRKPEDGALTGTKSGGTHSFKVDCSVSSGRCEEGESEESWQRKGRTEPPRQEWPPQWPDHEGPLALREQRQRFQPSDLVRRHRLASSNRCVLAYLLHRNCSYLFGDCVPDDGVPDNRTCCSRRANRRRKAFLPRRRRSEEAVPQWLLGLRVCIKSHAI